MYTNLCVEHGVATSKIDTKIHSYENMLLFACCSSYSVS